jgi:O-antigen biosynthesis protein
MLTWTGERYLPELEGNIALEHVHRYAMAREMAQGKRVLDIACGEGYGTAILADVAEWAIGVDISPEVIDHANLRYKRNNLKFKIGSCAKIPLKTASVDLVVSFETIEHDDQHEKMLSEIKRVLRPTGVLIISSPEKREYSVLPAYTNPYHVKELFRHEFEALMASHFRHVAMYGQRVIFGSGILQEGKSNGVASFTREDGSINATRGVPRPLYLVAVASDGPTPKVASSVFEQPIAESEVVKKWKEAVSERDGEIAALTQALASRDEQVAKLNQVVVESQTQIDGLKGATITEEEIAHLRQSATEGERKVAALQELLAQRAKEIGELTAVVSARDEEISGLNRRVVDSGGRIAELNRVVSERDEKIAALTQALASSDEQVEQVAKKSASESERRVAAVQELLAQRGKEIGELTAVLSARDEQISGLNRRVIDGGGRIGELNRLVSERDGRVEELEQILGVRDEEAANLRQTILDMTEEVGVCRQSTRAMESELKESRSRLAALVRSNSWRLTLPLREARRWVDAPRRQFERYKSEVLKRLKRREQVVPGAPGGDHEGNGSVLVRHEASVDGGQSARSMVTTSAGMRSGYSGSASAGLGRDIALATCDSPIVSVIVPVNGKLDETLGCLEAIHEQPPRLGFEVIVVCDGRVDASRDVFSRVSGIRLVEDTEREGAGYVQSCNAGARAARGEYLMFLSNESELASDWMARVERAVYGCPGAEVRIAALTMVYNEAGILPYFLRHYRYLDEIHVLYETDSTDKSLEILMQTPNVILEKGHIEGGLDDIEKVKLFNKAIQRIRTDWVYLVDPDEFVFPPDGESPHRFLSRQSCRVVRSGMYQVYRHRSDRDLDPSLAPIPQRTHGDPDLFSTQTEDHRAANSVYIKPNIVRPSKELRFFPGHHQIEGEPTASPELYLGAHWQMADPAIAIARRMERKARISERNKALKMGWQHFAVTIEKIKSECEDHLDDPVIDALSSFREGGSQALGSTGGPHPALRTRWELEEG